MHFSIAKNDLSNVLTHYIIRLTKLCNADPVASPIIYIENRGIQVINFAFFFFCYLFIFYFKIYVFVFSLFCFFIVKLFFCHCCFLNLILACSIIYITTYMSYFSFRQNTYIIIKISWLTRL